MSSYAVDIFLLNFWRLNGQIFEKTYKCICEQNKEKIDFRVKEEVISKNISKIFYYTPNDSIVFISRKSNNSLYISNDSLNKGDEIELYNLVKDIKSQKSKTVLVPVFGFIQDFVGVKQNAQEKLYNYKYSTIVIPYNYFPSVLINNSFQLVEFEYYDGMNKYKCAKE